LSPVPTTSAAPASTFQALLVRLGLSRSRLAAPHGVRLGDPAASLAVPAGRPCVLVADDSTVNQLMMQAMLSRWAITPMVAGDGAEAVALACGHDFDLILMDLQMPVLDGLTATAQIRHFEFDRGRPRTPVVVWTSHPVRSTDPALQSCGIDAVLLKPCTTDSLGACLTRWCAGIAAAGGCPWTA
jgi:CheY-like chemotaxis protein